MAAGDKYALLRVPSYREDRSSFLQIGTLSGDSFSWRDHTDGNRISTTRGDKIEVIGGRYQMVVLGRRQKPDRAGWEAREGQINQTSVTTKGKSNLPSQTLALVKGPRGLRMLRDTSVKCEVDTTYHGDVIDRHHGRLLESQTGDEVPPTLSYEDEKGSHPVAAQNPTILSRTWAESIASYVGSEKRRVPVIHEETWASTITTVTHVTSMKEATTADAMSDTTDAGSIVSETTACAISDTTTVKEGTITSTTTAQKVISKTYADTDDETHGNTSSLQVGDSKTTVHGVEKTVNLGMVSEVVLGGMTDVTLGATAGVKVGASLDLGMGFDTAISLSAKVESSLGVVLAMGPSTTSLALDRSKLAPCRKVVAAFTLLG